MVDEDVEVGMNGSCAVKEAVGYGTVLSWMLFAYTLYIVSKGFDKVMRTITNPFAKISILSKQFIACTKTSSVTPSTETKKS